MSLREGTKTCCLEVEGFAARRYSADFEEEVQEVSTALNILGFAGSLRKGSYNRGALRAAKELVPAEAELSIAEIDDVPLYNFDLETSAFPESVTTLKNRITASDAVLIVTPEYMYSVPGVLKNALDWISRPSRQPFLVDKPVGIMGASPGVIGTARAQLHLRQILLHERAAVMPHPQVLIADARSKFDTQGTLTDQESRERIKAFMEALVRWAQKFSS